MPVWGLSINRQWYIFKSICETLIRKIIIIITIIINHFFLSFSLKWQQCSACWLLVFSCRCCCSLRPCPQCFSVIIPKKSVSARQDKSWQQSLWMCSGSILFMCEQRKREGEHGDRPSDSRLLYSSVMQMKAVLEHWFVMHTFSQCIAEKRKALLINCLISKLWSQCRTTACALKQPAHLKSRQSYFCMSAFGSRFWEQIRMKFWHRFAHGSKPNHQIHHHSSLRSLPVISMVCPTEAGSQLEHDITMAMLLADSLRATLLWDRLTLASAPPSPHMRHPIKWTVSELDTRVNLWDNTETQELGAEGLRVSPHSSSSHSWQGQ